ncbi:2-oxoglutarate dehydrogenase, E2 component, dihydrolipoamide succinyltransferase [Haloglycomyces albus]|uniref:2-oxoglutarate dehydrogenase, E2 component, dihydrolipoamide succinyltransferase n=1 Tax=Haloglycomyces albus TaxID=526067 RepID=UPI00046C959F|nr:2-oxoglutarate dehydrogenase, E2 component, dihydrolipoamide succinyltransferase [Haloglycomyces albus]
MPTSVTMPALGESVTEGTVTQWLKQEGDTVEVDEPLLEVSTDKVDTEVPSPVAGTLIKIVAAEDAEVEVGGELAVVGEAGEAAGSPTPAPAEAPAEETPAEKPVEDTPAPVASAEAPASGGGEGTDVTLPELGESVTEGTVTQWLKAVGDTVEADEPLLEVSTDKVDTEIPSPAAGTLQDIRVPEDETANVGDVLAVIGTGAAPAADTPQESPAPQPAAPAEPKPEPSEKPEPAAAAPQPAAPAAPATTPPAAPTNKPTEVSYVTPLVRKLANENDVDLSQVTGTGVGGRIRKQDVQEVIDRQKSSAPAPSAQPSAPVEPSPLRGRVEKMTRLRQVAAKALHDSLQSQAQLTTVVEVDLTKVMNLRAAKKDEFLARHGVKLSPLPFMVVAAIEALQQYPIVNASMNMEEKTITYPEAENVGVAVDTEKGLIVPVIKNAGDLNIPGIARHTAELAEKARSGGLTPDDLSGGTFTVTNTGSRGALFDTPIVNAPQSAILGTGALVKRPVIVDDPELGEVVAPRQMMYLALSYDHRLIDGADAARFLQSVKGRLEEGNFEGALGL